MSLSRTGITLAATFLALSTRGMAQDQVITHRTPQGNLLGRSEIRRGDIKDYDRDGHYLGYATVRNGDVFSYDPQGHLLRRDTIGH